MSIFTNLNTMGRRTDSHSDYSVHNGGDAKLSSKGTGQEL